MKILDRATNKVGILTIVPYPGIPLATIISNPIQYLDILPILFGSSTNINQAQSNKFIGRIGPSIQFLRGTPRFEGGPQVILEHVIGSEGYFVDIDIPNQMIGIELSEQDFSDLSDLLEKVTTVIEETIEEITLNGFFKNPKILRIIFLNLVIEYPFQINDLFRPSLTEILQETASLKDEISPDHENRMGLSLNLPTYIDDQTASLNIPFSVRETRLTQQVPMDPPNVLQTIIRGASIRNVWKIIQKFVEASES